MGGGKVQRGEAFILRNEYVKELAQIMILADLYIIIWFYNYFSLLITTFTKRKRCRDSENNQFIDIKFLLAQISGDFFRFPQISPDLYPPPNTNNLILVKELPQMMILCDLYIIIWFYN